MLDPPEVRCLDQGEASSKQGGDFLSVTCAHRGNLLHSDAEVQAHLLRCCCEVVFERAEGRQRVGAGVSETCPVSRAREGLAWKASHKPYAVAVVLLRLRDHLAGFQLSAILHHFEVWPLLMREVSEVSLCFCCDSMEREVSKVQSQKCSSDPVTHRHHIPWVGLVPCMG